MRTEATTATDRIVVIGATGVVGREAIGLLERLGIPALRVLAAASERSAGQRVPYSGSWLGLESGARVDFTGASLVLLCADADTSRRLAPRALAAGATVIDNSSAFRMDPDVPLVVPEVNGQSLIAGAGGMIANPNCSTVILLVAIEALRREFGVDAIDVATYQAVSGAGAAGIDELLDQTRAVVRGEQPRPRAFHESCAFNLFSHDSPVEPVSGINGEERKIIEESRRILGRPDLSVTPTCVRVPVLRAHTQAITVTLGDWADEAQVRAAYERHGRECGVVVLDDRASNRFPTPLRASGGDAVLVGRIRPDPGEHRKDRPGVERRRWCLLACGDQLRKGAALNAIQIAQQIGLLPGKEPIGRDRTA